MRLSYTTLNLIFKLYLNRIVTFIAFGAIFLVSPCFASQNKEPSHHKESKPIERKDIIPICLDRLKKLPGPTTNIQFDKICSQVHSLPTCRSVRNEPIFHFEKKGIGTASQVAKNILVLSLIHGDEYPSGSVSRAWINRLLEIEPRNNWRIIPVANPDGVTDRTRTNANKVDVNRNFPSKDWENSALLYWKEKQASNPRRYPGPSSASEPETQCIIKHIEDFKPDFIISIHTPLGVLDFDGPPVSNPGFKPLPWVSLGNYPGSLGRYKWVDNKVPVLTIELKGNSGIQRLEDFDRLQDITGTIALQSDRLLQKEQELQKKDAEKRKNE